MKGFRKLNDDFYPVPLQDAPPPPPAPGPAPPDLYQPVVTEDPNYLQGYLKEFIGDYIKVQFIVGTNMFLDKEGILEKVGIDHITLRLPQTGNKEIADLYSIKFVEVY